MYIYMYCNRYRHIYSSMRTHTIHACLLSSHPDVRQILSDTFVSFLNNFFSEKKNDQQLVATPT